MDAREAILQAIKGKHPGCQGVVIGCSLDSSIHRRPSDRCACAAEADAILAALAANQLAVVGRGKAIIDVAAERQRQVEVEGWTPEHDDEHAGGALVAAAFCYVAESHWRHQFKGGRDDIKAPPAAWPWDRKWWKPKGDRPDLVRAAALIVAEIERLDRISPSPLPTGE